MTFRFQIDQILGFHPNYVCLLVAVAFSNQFPDAHSNILTNARRGMIVVHVISVHSIMTRDVLPGWV